MLHGTLVNVCASHTIYNKGTVMDLRVCKLSRSIIAMPKRL